MGGWDRNEKTRDQVRYRTLDSSFGDGNGGAEGWLGWGWREQYRALTSSDFSRQVACDTPSNVECDFSNLMGNTLKSSREASEKETNELKPDQTSAQTNERRNGIFKTWLGWLGLVGMLQANKHTGVSVKRKITIKAWEEKKILWNYKLMKGQNQLPVQLHLNTPLSRQWTRCCEIKCVKIVAGTRLHGSGRTDARHNGHRKMACFWLTAFALFCSSSSMQAKQNICEHGRRRASKSTSKEISISREGDMEKEKPRQMGQ